MVFQGTTLQCHMKTIRWGILGTGWIATLFAKGLNDLPGTELVAVGSRSQETADEFADKFDIPTRHASYEALAKDPTIDVIYVSSPHTLHKEHSLLCMAEGKAVLCEKPFTMNTDESEEMIAYAKANNIFLMEAMWTRFLPHMKQIKSLIADGAIGELRMLQADFGMAFPFNPEHRLFDINLGGGALLDAGIYPVSLAHYLFGPPTEIKSFANFGSTKVDEEVAIIMQHGEGQLSLLSTSLRLDLPHEAVILGTNGKIKIDKSWFTPTSFTLYQGGEEIETVTSGTEGELELTGYNYEALEVNNCLREGKLESSVMPLDETLVIMQTLDSLREQWGFKYPSEQ